jgi:tetratricopeptide (TPR) repeat protein
VGSLYFATGRVADAIDAYQKVLEASPGSAGALLGLGKCFFNSGELERARQYLEDVVATAPDSPQAAEARRFLEQLK